MTLTTAVRLLPPFSMFHHAMRLSGPAEQHSRLDTSGLDLTAASSTQACFAATHSPSMHHPMVSHHSLFMSTYVVDES